MQRFLFFLLFISLVLTGLFYVKKWEKKLGACPFCNPEVLKKQAFYEEELALALYDAKPVTPGHCLVIPRRHVERFEALTADEIGAIGEVIKKVNRAVSTVFDTSSYLLLEKNGIEVGQSVPHVHFHYVPRKKGETSQLVLLAKVFFAYLKGPISDRAMQENVAKLKAAITETE